MSRKGYEYNADFMNEAFGFFCQGISATGIAERMREEWPNVCRQTIGKIIKKYGWKKQRAEIVKIGVKGPEEKKTAIEILKGARDRLEKLIKEGSENSHHFSNLARMVEMIGRIEGWFVGGEESVVLSTDRQMNAMLDAMQEVLGDGIKKNMKKIKKIYEEKMRGIEAEG